MNTTIRDNLLKSIDSKSACVGVVGLGYVGLPLIKRLNDVGFPTIGFDIDGEKITALENGQPYIKHIEISDLQKAITEERCRVTTDFSHASSADILILCVPTPLNKYREPDLSYVVNSLQKLLPHLRQGQMVSLESTTYPGTTEEQLQPQIEATGLRIGEELFLVYSPEREDPGNKDFDTHSIPKVCGGISENCLTVGTHFYKTIIDQVVPVSSTKAAEMTKILENTYRAVNIALVNELKVVADKMGIDIFEVIDAAATKPFGYKAFYPGPGLGGHCIPIDPFYLTWKAKEFGLHTRFIELAGEVNRSMPDYVISKVTEGLNQRGRAVKGASILLIGVAYKKNVDDMRESPSIELIQKLKALGAEVNYHDPFVVELPKMRKHNIEMKSVAFDTIQHATMYDCIVIATNHDGIDYSLLEQANLVIDSRGILPASSKNIVRA